MQVVFSPGAEIKFEGANNFRELGGYRAADGRQVKYGLLYRGGNLDLLKSEADHARLASLGLREILDLRSAGESAAHPDPAVPGAHYQRVCGMRNADGTEMDFSVTVPPPLKEQASIVLLMNWVLSVIPSPLAPKSTIL